MWIHHSVPSWVIVSRVVADLTVFTGLSYAYADLLSYGESSIRTRILFELDRKSERGVTYQDVLLHYNAREVIGLRLNRLLCNDQLSRNGDRILIGSIRNRQLLLAKVYLGLRRLLFGSGELTSRSLRGG